MRFSTVVNVFLLGVATVVSALPISQITSSLDLESRDDFDELDMFEREFDEPTLCKFEPRVLSAVQDRLSGVRSWPSRTWVRTGPNP